MQSFHSLVMTDLQEKFEYKTKKVTFRLIMEDNLKINVCSPNVLD